MKSFKSTMIMVVMLFITMMSKQVIALEVESFNDISIFSIVIGDNMYTLEYANDLKNANEISDALVKHKGDIFIKTDDSGWIKNSDGKQVNKESVDVSSIKFYNGKEIASIVEKISKDTSGILVTSKVDKVQFTSAITKTGINTATFKYKVLDKDSTDITKTVPVSEINAVASVSSTISLEPLTGTGIITFNDSSDIDKLYIVTLLDNITSKVAVISSTDLGSSNNSDPKDVCAINFDTDELIKTGSNTATFKYKIINGLNVDITKTILATRITAIASVSSTIALDPSTATGTITYSSSADVDKPINISLVDQITGVSISATLIVK